ncbi:efflux RND transporter permease subunit [Desertifilum sp. FACHB-1129]|uniref:Cation transporter n=1 Tax=Desertifilum tharense IPPAS B-1220 TaxID=1781255 RepID=A0A1E5QNQ0_9CYAN|nr:MULTISPECIES: efflux RND transporter permease subunit [unclassified Desertifilum]MDA0212246.1 efflux RND transporter permease subunit [Cyanobacteria bacterium FC1]OEJ76268.1 cation transporter [Desertifilum tharense IPPAS B-1220]MBD2312825.1 efflux RND transporter permease subunit [Desertifilum sp. FACHB-1129]MBD2324189.1 efflux RND transporter permease subunit [Desertifilum sp. FACHB-866]MBD2334203.1 efflux RND transporter permease subunit [Desertifilum sp. FACHB-868]
MTTNNKTVPKPKASISATAIRRHIGTLMITLAIIAIGVFYVNRLPVDLLPAITYPRIGVRLSAPGISPEVAVDEITRPLEEALSATEGVIQVYSQTREGQVSVDLYFEPGGNIDQALNEATAAFNRSRGRLPDTIEDPRLFKVDPSQLPVYEFALTSDTLRGVDLRVFADEELARELNVVPGVASVDVSGGVREEVRVNLDLDRMQSLGVSVNQVLNTLRSRNTDISGGRLREAESEPLTRTVGRFSSAAEIRDLSFDVATASGDSGPTRRVFLRDFAQVVDGTEDERVLVSLNGQSAVKVSIQKQPDANTIEVVEGVKRQIETLRRSGLLLDDITLITTLDESRFIQNSINNVVMAGLTGSALAAIAVLMFLGSLRQTLIILIAIPLATMTAVILMGVFGLSINIFSLGGLALGVGIVVDNSIVMLENIVDGVEKMPHRNGNRSRNTQQIIQQSEHSAQELESALLASTTTNLVAVMPFLLIGGFIALLFNELILTISFAVAASLVIGITVVPALTSRLLAVSWSSRIREFWALREFNRRFEQATAGYAWFLRQVLRWRLLAIALAFVILGGGSFLMVGHIPQEILPRINTGQARLIAQFPPGTDLNTNRTVMAEIDRILQEQPETEYVFSTVGGFLFGANTNENLLRASSTITLKPGTNVAAFVERVTPEFNQLNLIDTRIRLVPESVRGLILNNSPVRGAEIDLALQGNDSQSLREAERLVMRALDENVTLARFRPDGDPNQPEVQILPDWERLAQVGLTAQDIGDTLATAIQGSTPTQLQRGNRLINIRVQLQDGAVRQVQQLQRLPLFAANRQQIRLGDVSRIEPGQAPGEIRRINQRQVALIAGNLVEGASLGDAIAQMENAIADLDLPEGVSILPSSSAQATQELQSALRVLGGLAAFLVFVVMAVQYNSLIDPLVIMLTVPLALAGGIFGLFITQTAIGATVIVGAVLLVGIVVNNAIIMVELANQIYEQAGGESASRLSAILKAAPQRLRPIMMTTITTVLGLFPLALGVGEGSEFLQPLGVVVFSGLSLATLLTLFIIPCFYVLLHELFGGGGPKTLKGQIHQIKSLRTRETTKVEAK